MFDAVAGWLGLTILISAIAVTMGLEALDAWRVQRVPGPGRHRRVWLDNRHVRWRLHVLLAVLIAGSVVATGLRFYFFVH
jgi:hypothetical protein